MIGTTALLHKRFVQHDIHREWNQIEQGIVRIVPGAVRATRDREGVPSGLWERQGELPCAGLDWRSGYREGEAEAEVHLQTGHDGSHGRRTGQDLIVLNICGTALRGREREREQLGAAGFAELAEITGG